MWCTGFGSSKKTVKKRRAPSINMPKKRSKKVAAANKAITKTITRAPTQMGVREEEEFSFNYYSKKVVKLQVVSGAESKIIDLKKKKKR